MWNESSTNFGDGFLDESTQGGESAKKGPQSSDRSIVPVMIKHITSSTGDLQIAGKSVNTLTFVGIVRNIEQDTTKISFTIQDDTGTVTAVMWLEADKNPSENICTQVNTYVRVYGLLRNQNNQQHVLILRMHLIEDLNELTCHLMEVMYFILKAKKPVEESALPQQYTSATFDNTISSMTSDQVAVLEVVRSASDSECGIEKCDILTKVLRHVIPRIDEILAFLLCEGRIYTTSSEHFFKAV